MFPLDRRIFQFMYAAGHHNAFWDSLAVFFGNYLPYFLVFVFLVLVYYRKGWRQKVFFFCEAALAVILSWGLIAQAFKYFYHLPRPYSFYNFTPLFTATGWSFPSLHAAWFFALAMTVWFAKKSWGWWFFALAAFMGIARIYAGIHWPSDIIVGAAIGIVSGIAVHRLLEPSRRRIE